MDSNADADLLLGPEAKGVRRVEMGQRLSHGQRRSHCLAAVIVDIERGIPEGHDRIADIFVESAFVGGDMTAQRVKQRVEEADHGSG